MNGPEPFLYQNVSEHWMAAQSRGVAHLHFKTAAPYRTLCGIVYPDNWAIYNAPGQARCKRCLRVERRHA